MLRTVLVRYLGYFMTVISYADFTFIYKAQRISENLQQCSQSM